MKWNDGAGFYQQDAWGPSVLGWRSNTPLAMNEPTNPALANNLMAFPTGNTTIGGNPGMAGYEQPNPNPLALQQTQPQQNGLSRLMSGAYQGPQLKSMWQGYKPQARGMYRMGG